jgi:hypothetical protein
LTSRQLKDNVTSMATQETPAGLALLLRHNVDVVLDELDGAARRPGSALAALVAARTAAEVIEDATRVLAERARADGHTWAEIGALLRTTRQAAQQRYGGEAMETTKPEDAVLAQRATEIVEQLRDGEWEAVTLDWAKVMRDKMSADELAEVWRQLGTSVGALQTAGRPSVVRKGPFRVADVPLAFEHGPMKARVTFDHDDAVCGLWFLPPDAE